MEYLLGLLKGTDETCYGINDKTYREVLMRLGME